MNVRELSRVNVSKIDLEFMLSEIYVSMRIDCNVKIKPYLALD